jgi:hypothetical protein
MQQALPVPHWELVEQLQVTFWTGTGLIEGEEAAARVTRRAPRSIPLFFSMVRPFSSR